MTRSVDIRRRLLEAIAGGELAAGAALPSVRTLARREGSTPTTAARAYGELARDGVIATAPRRAARVTDDGPLLARRLLRGAPPLRLAGSDDPLLDELVGRAGVTVERQPAGGSFAGLTALWRGQADAAALHLWHRDGEYNAPYATQVLAGRDPCLVRLWRREQGIVVPAGNPLGIERVADLARVTVARRGPGTGTQVLLDRLLRDAGAAPGAVRGPRVGSHFEVALAVASGVADAGVAVRAVAEALGLAFVSLAWEPFDLALSRDHLDRARELLAELDTPELRGRAQRLGGYDLGGAGQVRALGERG